MFGLHAALGRLFNESDDKHGGGPEGYAAVLSYNYWRSHLGGDPGVIGRVLDLQDKKAIIVGVLQPGFDSVTVGDRPWIYLPSEVDDPGERHGYGSFDRMIFARKVCNFCCADPSVLDHACSRRTANGQARRCLRSRPG